jgi:hypothetical protein
MAPCQIYKIEAKNIVCARADFADKALYRLGQEAARMNRPNAFCRRFP